MHKQSWSWWSLLRCQSLTPNMTHFAEDPLGGASSTEMFTIFAEDCVQRMLSKGGCQVDVAVINPSNSYSCSTRAWNKSEITRVSVPKYSLPSPTSVQLPPCFLGLGTVSEVMDGDSLSSLVPQTSEQLQFLLRFAEKFAHPIWVTAAGARCSHWMASMWRRVVKI